MELPKPCRHCESYKDKITYILSKILECDSVYILAEVYDKFAMTELIKAAREQKNIKKKSPKCYGYLYAKFTNLKTMLSGTEETEETEETEDACSKICQTQTQTQEEEDTKINPEKDNADNVVCASQKIDEENETDKTPYLKFNNPVDEEDKDDKEDGNGNGNGEGSSPCDSYDDEIGEYIRNAAKLLKSKQPLPTEPENVKLNPSLSISEGGRKQQV